MSNSRYLQNIRAMLSAPAIRQIIFLLGIAGGATLGMYIYMTIKEPTYQPLDYQINQQNMASITDTLDKAGIQYKVNDTDGMLYVSADDIQQAKIKLSAAGVAKDDSVNFSYLNDQTGIGNSQFMENTRYSRALESDLSRTISAIEGISNAKVHIAIPQNNVFADENQRPTASIVVNLAPGLSSDKEKIRAIVQIVASSVPGLDPKDVAITDQYGHYLSGILDQNSLHNAEQLSYQNNIQNYYEKRIESMITPLLGDNKVNVRVNANIDFTQSEEAQEQYDPDKKVLRSEQESKEESGSSGSGGAPGALANSPPSNDSSAPATSTAATDTKNQSVKNYEINKSVIYKKTSHPKVVSLSVAVVLDNETVLDPATHKSSSKAVAQDKITKITDLVKATIGFDEKRGDIVTIVNSSFNIPTVADVVVPPAKFWNQPWFWDYIKKTMGILLGFGFLYLLYMKLSTYIGKTIEVERRYIPSVKEDDTAEIIQREMHDLKLEKINKLKELANKDPDRVALILKNWVGK